MGANLEKFDLGIWVGYFCLRVLSIIKPLH